MNIEYWTWHHAPDCWRQLSFLYFLRLQSAQLLHFACCIKLPDRCMVLVGLYMGGTYFSFLQCFFFLQLLLRICVCSSLVFVVLPCTRDLPLASTALVARRTTKPKLPSYPGCTTEHAPISKRHLELKLLAQRAMTCCYHRWKNHF